MGYRLNRLDEPVFMAVPKPMLTEFGIHYRLESCAKQFFLQEHLGGLCKQPATLPLTRICLIELHRLRTELTTQFSLPDRDVQ